MGEQRRGSWTVPELDRLRRLVIRGGVGHAARELGRSEESVRRRLQTLRPPSGPEERHGPWAEEDSRMLREAWGVLSPEELGLLLHRTEAAIHEQAERLRRQLRRGPWQGEELRTLRRAFGTRSNEDLEVVLGRSQKEIREQAERLCLAKDRRFPSGSGRRMPRWTSQEVERLREVYPHRDNLDVARELGRSVASVANKANQLGLHKSPEILAQLGRRNVALRHGASPEQMSAETHAQNGTLGGSAALDPDSGRRIGPPERGVLGDGGSGPSLGPMDAGDPDGLP